MEEVVCATLLDTHAVWHQVEHAGAMGKKNKKKQQQKEAKKAEEEEAEFKRMLDEFKLDDASQGRHVAEPPPDAVCTRGPAFALLHTN